MTSHNIPINGRVVIVDDQIDQARPLMNLFGKLQIPYIYYDGDRRNLPPQGYSHNDVRLLFLDINLMGNEIKNATTLKSVLIGLLDRIISPKNYPYLMVYWSRQANEYSALVKEIFDTDKLKYKRPISFVSANKQDFWDLDGKYINESADPLKDLFHTITEEIKKFPVYGYLLDWENQIHISADKTLEETFRLGSLEDEWNRDSNSLFYKLALAYSGKNLTSQKGSDQIKSACLALNSIFTDSLEYSIGEIEDDSIQQLAPGSAANSGIIASLNRKLLISNETKPNNIPGLILQCNDKKRTRDFEQLLRSSFKDPDKILADRDVKWDKIFLLVTPVCDFAQGKFVFNKLVGGIMMDAKYKKVNASEAVFISPVFELSDDEKEKVIVLNYAHQLSLKKISSKSFRPLFRIRQQLLAEIQSKLSRHINRQGVLFLN